MAKARNVLGETIRQERKSRGWSQTRLGDEIGVSGSAVSQWESGQETPNRDHLFALASVFKKQSINELMGKPELSKLGEAAEIPLLSWSEVDIAGVALSEKRSTYNKSLIPDHGGISLYALKIEGDTMAPEFSEGDEIVVDPYKAPKDKSYVIVKSTGESPAILRQLRIEGDKTYLVPHNPRYPIEPFPNDAVICGVVISRTKNYI